MRINLGSKNRCGYFAKAALIVTYGKRTETETVEKRKEKKGRSLGSTHALERARHMTQGLTS